MKKTIITLSIIGLFAMPSYALAGEFAARNSFSSEKDEVITAFTKWREALSSGNAANVVKLYEENAILLPTLSPKVLTTQSARSDYFTTLVAKPKLQATVNEEHTRILDSDNAIVSGLYTFSFEENGKRVDVPARFSFVYEKENGQWMIVEHHSSKVPANQP